ncbi:unnamed protein product [Effrenium voratum]|nr:unnamed protein product [Effrenium voratum]
MLCHVGEALEQTLHADFYAGSRGEELQTREPALRPWPAEPVAREDLERAGWPRQREPSVREDPAARTLWPEPAPCDGEEHSPAGRSEEHGGDRREEPAPAASSQEGGIKLQIKLPRREDPPAPAPAAPPKPPPPEAPEAAGHLAAAGEEFDGPPRCSEAQLELWRRRLAALEQRELLMEVWHRWFALTRVSTLQSRLELLLTDELRLAKVREEAMSEWAAEFGGYFSQKLWEPEVNFWPEEGRAREPPSGMPSGKPSGTPSGTPSGKRPGCWALCLGLGGPGLLAGLRRRGIG